MEKWISLSANTPLPPPPTPNDTDVKNVESEKIKNNVDETGKTQP